MLPGCLNFNNLQDRAISPSIRAQLYNDCIYPAVLQAVHEGEAGHWIPTYEAEQTRSRRGNKGRLQNSGRLIPADCVQQFGQELLRNVAAKPWGKGVYYFHELRGTRGATQHSWNNHQLVLNQFLDCIDLSLIDERQWWIDIGIEVQSQGSVIWWRTDTHRTLIANALQLNIRSTDQMLAKPKTYYYDEACQLEDIGGFRLKVPTPQRLRTGIAYIQAYNTEKEGVYRLTDEGNTLTLSYQDVVLNPRFKIQHYTDPLAKVWAGMRRKSDGHARFELRVNLAQFDLNRQYLTTSDEMLQASLCQIERHTWWYVILIE
jgi:hypothetical protein